MSPNTSSGGEEFSAQPHPASYRTAEPGRVDALNLQDVWTAVLFYRWMAVAIVIASISACAAIAFFSTPIYRAEVLMAPVKGNPGGGMGGLGALARQLGGLGALTGALVNGNDMDLKHEAMALLESRSFLVAFISDENLMPVLYPDTWGSAQGQSVDPQWPRYSDAYRMFSEQILNLRDDADTGFVKLDIEWRDARLAAQWAKELVARMNAQMRQRAISESELSVKYLAQELERTTSVDVKQDINQVIETTVSQTALAHARQEYAFRVIDPAAVSDPDDFVRPRRVLLIISGVVIGGTLAVMLALIRFVLAARHKRFTDR